MRTELLSHMITKKYSLLVNFKLINLSGSFNTIFWTKLEEKIFLQNNSKFEITNFINQQKVEEFFEFDRTFVPLAQNN